jgi:hypothetical protein
MIIIPVGHNAGGERSLAQDKGRYTFLVNFLGYFLIRFFYSLVLLTADDGVPVRGLAAAYCVRIPVCILAPFLSEGLGQ